MPTFLAICFILAVADLEIEKGGFSAKCSRKFKVATPTFGHVEVRTEYLEATLGLVKRLEISKELMRERVTMPGCCYCMHATAV